MKIRKIAGCILVMCMAVFIMAGCSNSGKSSDSDTSDADKLNVVTTIFPYYDFVRQVAGDKVDLTMIVPSGMDTHSFEPTASDMVTMGDADVLIYNGGEMETWVSKVLEATAKDTLDAEAMMDNVDVVAEETVEGMESDDEEEDEAEYDEHIWTSPVNAQKIVTKISEILGKADPDNAKVYEKNADKYIEKLKKLDREFKDVVTNSKRQYLVFGDRFPLRYFVDEYGLYYSAAFAGCSSDTEPSADTVAYLIDRVKEEKVPVVLKIELTSSKVADTIADATGASVETFYTCHNVTQQQFNDGVTYLDLMEKNVSVLQDALGVK